MVVNYLEIKATDILSLNHQEKTLQVFVQASFVIINVGKGSFLFFLFFFPLLPNSVKGKTQ